MPLLLPTGGAWSRDGAQGEGSHGANVYTPSLQRKSGVLSRQSGSRSYFFPAVAQLLTKGDNHVPWGPLFPLHSSPVVFLYLIP